METVPIQRPPSSRERRGPRALGVPPAVAILAGVLSIAPGCSSGDKPEKAAQEAVAPVGQGFNLNASDLRFIRQQIRIAESHAAGSPLFGPGPNQVPHPVLPYGLRTVDGSWNNVLPGQETYGSADKVFPRMTAPSFRPAENAPPSFGGFPTSYTQKKGLVFDSRPRLVSNLIADQSPANPAAVAAAGPEPVLDGPNTLLIPNVAPDVGLSAPYNSMFTLFGQFFDHGLDLVTKGGGTVFVPLLPDDPLFIPGSPTNFMVLTRATNRPGPDGILGDDPATPADESADDVQEATNTTTPFVDQNQTYTSHPSHQVFLREYRLDPLGRPVATGRLIDGAIAGNIGNWSEVKAQARDLLGIALADVDVLNVPLLATDPYGRFIRGPNGFPQLVMPGNVLVEGNPAAPVPVTGAVKTGHAFLDDIAHHAAPVGDHDNNPGTPPRPLLPDADPGTADDHDPATYDDELLGAHFVTGDGRGNENIGLTAVHSVFHAEHNRLVADIHRIVNGLTQAEIDDWNAVHAGSGWDYGERLFQAARFVTEMEYQHLVFEEFGRKVQPMINLFAGYHTDIDPAIVAEFAHTVYRFGHSMLNETVARINEDGSRNDMPLLTAFLNPLAFNDGGAAGILTAEQAAGSIVRGMALQVGNELDEFVTEALRNRLLGLPLDLATINLARGRSEGVATLNDARRQFYAQTANFALAPYASWAELGFGLRHPESLVNFIAAYGTHPSITGGIAERRAAAEIILAMDPANPATPPDAFDFVYSTGDWADLGGPTVTGVDDVDFWMGGLAEKQAPFGGLLGSTFNHVFETQLEKLQDGDRFYYLTRTAGLNLLVQLEGNSFAELVMRNTDATNLPADVFSRPDYLFDLARIGTSGPILDDPTTPDVDESAMPDLVRMPNGTVRYTGPAHVIFAGTDDPNVVDRMWSSEGDDTMRGHGGRDVMEGGAGNDNLIGGEGDDIMTDAFGDDVLKGGDGNDAMSSGPGFDLNQGGLGHDFVVGGSDPTETFGGPGNDLIFGGDSTDTVFGDDGDDWIEGGGQADLLQGDNGAPFQNDPNAPGHDVIIGGGGDDDYDSEGGDDVMVTGPGIERNEGMLGFDWVTHRGDPQPANADLNRTAFAAPDLDTLTDRFDLVEGLSGWRFDDLLLGSSADAASMVGHELGQAGIDRIDGLAAILGGATSFTGGDILLGGAGSDVIEGRQGNDVIDGDAWLNVQLRAPNPATADPDDFQLVDSMLQLRPDVFAGRINPGDISIVRSIVFGDAGPADVDTAVYSGARAEYLITVNANGTVTVDHQGGVDGVDTLRNMELLRFTDGTIPVPTNAPATGTVTISDVTPTEDQLLGATSLLADPDGLNAATLVHTWQAETAPGVWTDVATGTSFSPGDAVVGLRLRVVASFQDNAVPPADESVASAPTAPVIAVNDAPTGTPLLSDTTPQVAAQLSAITSGIADADGLGPFAYQWRANGVAITGATGVSFTPGTAQLGQALTVVVSYVDRQGFPQSLVSAPTALVVPASGAIVAVQGTLNFGLRRVNTSTVGQLTVTNPGTAPLVISSVTSTGAPFVNPSRGTCTAPLNPGSSCRITVTFLPTAPGPYAGTLTVTSNATNSPTLVSLTGTGR